MRRRCRCSGVWVAPPELTDVLTGSNTPRVVLRALLNRFFAGELADLPEDTETDEGTREGSLLERRSGASGTRGCASVRTVVERGSGFRLLR